MKKYEFTGETMQFVGKTLKRIRRLSDGLIGGWIEDQYNLSQEGECFVYDKALVYGDARVYEDAQVYENARVDGSVQVCGSAQVHGDARLYGEARVYGDARVYGHAQVFENVWICRSAYINKRFINITGLKHNITITDNYIMIGCEAHSINHWKKNIVKIGKERGYTKEEIQKVINMFKVLDLKEL